MRTCGKILGKILVVLLLTTYVTFVSTEKDVEYFNKSLMELMKYRLRNHIVPRHYDIRLTFSNQHPHETVINGESNITIHIMESTKLISLHYVGFIMKVELYRSFDMKLFVPDEFYYNENSETVNIIFSKELLDTAMYECRIKYVSRLSIERSIYTAPYHEIFGKDHFIVTSFQPIGARFVFPCWDEPALRTTFQLSVQHYKNYTIYSNTDINDISIVDNEFILNSFEKTSLMSTYQVAITSVPSGIRFDTYNIHNIYTSYLHENTISCRNVVVEQTHHLYYIINLAVEKLSSYISLAKDGAHHFKTTHLILPGIKEEVIVNWGLIVYRETAVLFDRTVDTLMQRLKASRLIIRATTKEWFNYLLSPTWWTYLWLHEGFAHFFAIKIDSEEGMRNLCIVQTRYESLNMDVDSNMMVLENDTAPENIFLSGYPLHVKAPAILYMLENILSPEVFRTGIISYFQKNLLYAASTDQLWQEMQDALISSDIYHTNYVLKNVIDTWIKQQNYPTVKVEHSDLTKVIICRKRLNNITSENWWIPVTFTKESTLNFSNTLPQTWLTTRHPCTTVNLLHDREWILVNIQQTGYYRVNYDMSIWDSIGKYLNFGKFTKIHVLNRAQLVDDAYYFMTIGQLDFDMFKYVTNYLGEETDYTAWYPMFKNFESFSRYLPFTECARLKEHMFNIVTRILQKIGYEEIEDEHDTTIYLRQEAVKWACFLGHYHCKLMANNKLTDHLKYPKHSKLLPGWKDWTYCYGLNIAGAITWHKFWHRYGNSLPHMKMLQIVTCAGGFAQFNVRHIIQNVHNATIKSKSHYECINLLHYILMLNAEQYLDITLGNLKDYMLYCTFTKKDIKKILTVIINHLYANYRIQQLKYFVEHSLPEISVHPIQRQLAKRQQHLANYWSQFSYCSY